MLVRRLFLFLPVLLLVALPVLAQQATPDAASDNLEAFAPLDLPDANELRAATGAPGPDYWQQRADYRIQVRLDPATHRLSGSETIRYTNNSPEALDYLWLQLDQNFFVPDSRGSYLQPPVGRYRGYFEEGGYEITNVALVHGGERTGATFWINDTQMRITLPQPLPPNATMDVSLEFAFTIPAFGADRLGWLEVEQGTIYTVAQWYPRVAVFDDVNGWNPMPFLGQGEFYLEYGDFDVEITVPRDFIVTAGAALQNPTEVLTAEQQRRVAAARRSATTVRIIEPGEVGQPGTRPEGDDWMTWKFRAEDVRDFSWAASQAFIWDAAGYENTLVQSFYPMEGLGDGDAPGWEEATRYGRHSIQYYSEQWYPYPYPVAVNVAGIVSGMEYPMIVFCGVEARGPALFGVTDHEFGHEWFPMLVGNDERRHVWMDEGFDTFMNYYSTNAFYGVEEPVATANVPFIISQMQARRDAEPIATYTDRIVTSRLGYLGYFKPGFGLVLLRDYILGPERFDPAFREYIDRWAYKHPQPADFFRTMEDASGEDLDWFWRGWFYTTNTLDHAIGGVATNDQGTTYIQLLNKDDLLMPADLEIHYADGSTERRRIPVEAFFKGDEYFVLIDRADIVAVTLDPDQMLPDLDRTNDRWEAEDGALVKPAKGE